MRGGREWDIQVNVKMGSEVRKGMDSEAWRGERETKGSKGGGK